MALQKVLLIDNDEKRCLEIKTVLSFLDYKVNVLEIEKLANVVNAEESPLIVLAEGVKINPDIVHGLFVDRKLHQPILYIHNKGRPATISKILRSYLVPLEWPTSYQSFVKSIRQLQSSANSLTEEMIQRATELFRSLVGNSQEVKRVRQLIQQVCVSDATVLILGESGTGKEVIARNIHYHSARRQKAFVPINCGAIPAELIESELFGHEKGAFTGATERRIGRFEEADGGTLFLDEIGEIDLNTQVKLLRAIGERTIERLGSNKPQKVDVRVVAATNKDLSEMVKEGTFRDDLFFRLNVVSIQMPPLRDRKEDIVLLVEAFLKEFGEENNKSDMDMTQDAMQLLLDYDWPGNVRELRTAVEHGVVMSNSPKIGVRHLPMFLRDDSHSGFRPGTSTSAVSNVPAVVNEHDLNLATMEQKMIRLALERTGDNRTEAAQLLGISRRTMQRKLKEMSLVED